MSQISAKDFINHKKQEWENELKARKSRRFKDIGREGAHHFLREAWTLMPQYNLEEKVFTVERLRRTRIEGKTSHPDVKEGDLEYRFGYYIIGKNGNKKGRWTWGQYCPLIPLRDFEALLTQARQEGTISSALSDS